jgi:dTMP kinase
MRHLFDPDGISSTLDAGVSVICDRYELSSLAYQSVSGLDMQWLLAVNAPALTPDFTIFLDVPPEICLARIAARGDASDAFHAPDFLRRVDVAYREAISTSRKLGQLFHIDGTADELAVHHAIVDRVVGAL